MTNTGSALTTVRATARFLNAAGAQLFAESMPLRWSRMPEPTLLMGTPQDVQLVVDWTKFRLSYETHLAPGDSHDAAVAVRHGEDGSVWGWTAESYAHNFRHPAWKLPQDSLLVDVTVWADGREVSRRFALDCRAGPGKFRVTIPN